MKEKNEASVWWHILYYIKSRTETKMDCVEKRNIQEHCACPYLRCFVIHCKYKLHSSRMQSRTILLCEKRHKRLLDHERPFKSWVRSIFLRVEESCCLIQTEYTVEEFQLTIFLLFICGKGAPTLCINFVILKTATKTLVNKGEKV